MISFEVFEDVTYEITDTFPEVFFRELNGGVMVREYSRLHPAALDHDLFVLGEYHHDRYLGRFIVLYYGSFVNCFTCSDEDPQGAAARVPSSSGVACRRAGSGTRGCGRADTVPGEEGRIQKDLTKS